MNTTCERLCHCRLTLAHTFRNPEELRCFNDNIVRKRTVITYSEESKLLANIVATASACFTFATGQAAIHRHAVTDLPAIHILSQLHNPTGKLMTDN